MGTTDNYDAPAKAVGTFAGADKFPIIDSVTGRAASALGSDVATFVQTNGLSIAAASTAANLPNYGITTLSSTTASTTYTLNTPVAGVKKYITALIASTTTRIINAGTGATYDGTNNLLTSTGAQHVVLVGISTTRWNVISNYSATTGGMSLSTA